MALLTKDEIFEADDLQYIEMEIPEWGGSVRIGVLSGYDRERFEKEWTEDKVLDEFQARVNYLAACLIDENGKPMFTRDELHKLNKKNWLILERIIKRSMQLSAIGNKSVEALAKN